MLPSELFAKRYILNEVLGQGGMGIVYHTTDRLSGQDIALKQVLVPIDAMMLASGGNTDQQIALTREFQTLASLRHPNIINVLDYGFHKDANDSKLRPYFTMTLLKDSIHILQAGRQLGNEGKLYLILQVLQALEYLHKRGIIHHDLKPTNILVFNEQVKLLDFGLAIKPGGSIGVQGTLPYMSPELLNGANASVESDLYAMGIIAYELFVGHHPYDVKNLHNLIKGILKLAPDISPLEDVDFYDNEPVISKASLDAYIDDTTRILATNQDIEAFYSAEQNTEISAEPIDDADVPSSSLARIILRLLAKDPAERYASASDVLHEFNTLLDEPFVLETAEIRESYLQAANFVGRTSEQSLLSEALNNLTESNGSAWLIGGESGVGKTRFLDEIRIKAMVQGALVLVGQSVEGGGLPYQFWRNILRRLCLMVELTELETRVIKPLVPDIERLLGKPIADPPELNSNETKVRLITTITTIIKRYPDPLVLIFEDLQWANESLSILQTVLDVCTENPLVIIGSFRDDEAPNLPEELPQMEFIKLYRLNYDEIAELSEAMLGALGMQEQILELLHDETDGNVFFLVETVRALAEQAGQLSKIDTIELPRTVFSRGIRDIVDRRLNGIAPEYQAILRLASIMGQQINLPLLANIVQNHADYSLKDLDKWLDVCSSSAILEVNDQIWRFTHGKIRQGIAEQLVAEDSKQLHERVASAIEDIHEDLSDYAVTLAQHWQLAGNPHKEMKYRSLAGNLALERGTFVESSININRALELHESLDIEDQHWYWENCYNLAQAYLHQGAFEESLNACEPCLTIAHDLDDKKLIVDATYLRGSIALRQGNLDLSKEYLQTSLSLSRTLDNIKVTSLVLMWLGALAIMAKDFLTADEYLEESLTLAQQIDNYDSQLASILNTKAENLRYQKRFEESIPFYEQSIELFTKLGHFYALSAIPLNLALAYFEMGNWQLAESKYYEILKNAIPKNNRMVILGCLAGLGSILYKQNEYLDAIQLIGLVMRHSSTTAETKMFIAQPIIDKLQDKIENSIYEDAYSKLKIENLDEIAKNMLHRN